MCESSWWPVVHRNSLIKKKVVCLFWNTLTQIVSYCFGQVEVRSIPNDMGRGLFASVEIEPGEVIISVPWSNVFASQVRGWSLCYKATDQRGTQHLLCVRLSTRQQACRHIASHCKLAEVTVNCCFKQSEALLKLDVYVYALTVPP